ncbi:MAG: hypothetical protein ACKVU4_00500 [Phycisphaerales bacterium]
MNRLSRGLFLGLVAPVAPIAGLAGAAYGQAPPPIPTITNLGVLPTGAITSVMDVSGDGKVAVGQCFTQPGGWRAFRWISTTGIQNLGTLPGGNFSTARGASFDGLTIIGGSNSTIFSSLIASFWQNPGPMTSPVTNVLNYWEAFGISGNGLVGVGHSGNTNNAVRWSLATGKVVLGTLPGHVSSAAYATNGDGSVVVGGSAPAFPDLTGRAFRWTSAGMADLGVPAGSISSVALGVSSDGLAVVGLSSPAPSTNRAFLWTQDSGMRNLGALGGSGAVAYGVDALARRVVGATGTPSATSHAFLWTPELGMVDLNTYLPALGTDLTGWVLQRANAISDDGTTIVGDGSFNGFGRGWIVKLDLDTDGDGLLDNWETDGVPYLDSASVLRRFPLPGADPMEKDLYVEVDAMDGQGLSPASAQMVVEAFIDAPVPNPNSIPGINLHILDDESDLPHVSPWATGIASCWPKDFDDWRGSYFGTSDERDDPNAAALLKAKAKAYRYCIFADKASSGWGGCGGQPGDSYVIYQGSVSTAERDAAKFMHELGHNLNLGHGGGDGMNGKPNYPSIMNYVFAYPYAWCESFWKLDYSREDLGTLDEDSLDETAGIGTPGGQYTNWYMPYGVNFNNGTAVVREIHFVLLHGDPTDFGNVAGTGFQDGLFTTGVKQDLNYAVDAPLQVRLPSVPSPGLELQGHDDWANIRLPVVALHSPQAIPQYPQDELTEEGVDWINQNFPHAPSACYADCNTDGALTVADFGCFQTAFVLADPYADCTADGSLTVADFGCFQTAFVIGCP